MKEEKVAAAGKGVKTDKTTSEAISKKSEEEEDEAPEAGEPIPGEDDKKVSEEKEAELK